MPGVVYSGVTALSFGVDAKNLTHTIGRLSSMQRVAVPKATRWALNDMAFDVFRENKELMKRVFDDPTRFTLNAFRVQKATLQNLNAVVLRKTIQGTRHYLEVESDGGQRPQTGFERHLFSKLKSGTSARAVLPTSNTPRTASGSISRAFVNRVIASVEGGATQSRRRGSRYFVPRSGSKLTPGVYEDNGDQLLKVLAFSDAAPSYAKRFPMEEHATKVAAEGAESAFERGFRRALSEI